MTVLLGVNHKMTTKLEEPPENPYDLFDIWMKEAETHEHSYANAMSLATSSQDGRPSVRTVLLKEVDQRGFVFYTNTQSRKGRALSENPKAELLFYWKSIERQIRINGAVETVSDEEANAYFKSRPRDSQIGAWASQQSQPLDNRETFTKAFEEIDEKYKGTDIPRPPHWTGYRVKADYFEFWIEFEFRLHHRFAYDYIDGNWTHKMLYP